MSLTSTFCGDVKAQIRQNKPTIRPRERASYTTRHVIIRHASLVLMLTDRHPCLELGPVLIIIFRQQASLHPVQTRG